MRLFYKETSWDLLQPFCILCLMAIGVVTIYSAQFSFQGEQWKLQSLWICMGIIIYSLASCVDYKFYLRHAHWIYAFSILLLVLLWTPLGLRRFGAIRWLRLGGLRLQPSELAKAAILFMVSSTLARSEITDIQQTYKVPLKVFGVLGLPALLIFLEPDLGSTLALPPMVFALLFLTPLSGKFFLGVLGIIFSIASIVIWDIYSYQLYLDKHHLNPLKDMGQYEAHSWLPLKDYQRNRILGFIAPQNIDPKGTGISWNLRQSLIAVGTGGLKGRGFCQGMQSKLGYLPPSVATNDFIFSVIAEEWGFLGAAFILLLYTLLVIDSFCIAWKSRDSFGRFMAVGSGILWLIHILINIGMTLGLTPITGIPLPFLSYGGSFIILCCFLGGVIQSIHHYRHSYA